MWWIYVLSLIFIMLMGTIGGNNLSKWINNQERANNLVFGVLSLFLGFLATFVIFLVI